MYLKYCIMAIGHSHLSWRACPLWPQQRRQPQQHLAAPLQPSQPCPNVHKNVHTLKMSLSLTFPPSQSCNSVSSTPKSTHAFPSVSLHHYWSIFPVNFYLLPSWPSNSNSVHFWKYVSLLNPFLPLFYISIHLQQLSSILSLKEHLRNNWTELWCLLPDHQPVWKSAAAVRAR